MGIFKIKSKFYVIMGDNNPIYVGYTNRTVKQRFKEHLRNKDFSKYDFVKVAELSDYEVDFNFTWDYLIIQKDAEIVDKTERYLINKFGTQNSSYQMIINGGQNWAEIKHFVFSNKNNPKFKNMSGSKIGKYLKSEQKCIKFLSHFVSDMLFPEKAFLQSFVSSMRYPEESFVNSFVKIMIFPEEMFLYNFVNDMEFPEKRFLKDFVKDMEYPEEMFLHNFVNNMIPTEKLFLSNFINHMKERNND